MVSDIQFRVSYDDDPDLEQAGQGLQSLPIVVQAIGGTSVHYWMMSPAEQVALAFLLQQLRPKIAIEIGTRFGGSLQVLSHYCEHVYAIDIDQDVPKRLGGKFSNVDFLIGPSDEKLPPLLTRLGRERAPLEFALVDGDHSTNGVRKDIDHLMRFRPTVPLYIVMHDSFNPACREGLRQAQWASNPYVHVVELDFVPGTVNPAPAFRDQLWGGLALGVLLPHERTGRFEITARAEQTFKTVRSAQESLLRRAASRVKRIIKKRSASK